METNITSFTKHLLDWFQNHGRHDLPWQQNPTPYRVWVSEIMLQQTQVSTVINYYQRFMNTFSSIKLLAEANQDQVLSHWAGLGYYARARNLHATAQIISKDYAGVFPNTIDELTQLPGIGRSTAGAILSLSMGIRAPILDGNVKRVLTRFHAIEGVTSKTATANKLWQIAEQHTPFKNHNQYTQAIMDLGATICVRSKPLCQQCPVIKNCQAYSLDKTQEFPTSKKAIKTRPKKNTCLLILKTNDHHIFLEKRPNVGIWGGLLSFPECEIDTDIKSWCSRQFEVEIVNQQPLPVIIHQFSHFELALHPILLTVKPKPTQKIMEASLNFWYNLSTPLPGGAPAPIAKLLHQLKGDL